MLRMIDVFAGCGGMTLGFESTGAFRSVLAIEMDADAAATYRCNFEAADVLTAPIEQVPSRSVPTADIVIGGPPCQGFSLLNRGGVGLERRKLWREYVRILDASGAWGFVMENVPGLLTSPEFHDLRRSADQRGFRLAAGVLNAADHGVPQTRRRAIVIGLRGAPPSLPNATHADPRRPMPLGTLPWRTFRGAVEGLPLDPDERNWHRSRAPRPESLERYASVPHDGGDRFQMQRNLDARGRGDLVPRCWRNKPRGTTDVFGRLWWDRPAVTIRTEFYKPEKGRYLHPTQDRPITVREAARCMSFPDEFVFPEQQSLTAVGRQVGNAVPPQLAHQSAHQLLDALETGTRAHAA